MTGDGRFAAGAVYVAGRFGKVYLSSRSSDGPPLPTAQGILGAVPGVRLGRTIDVGFGRRAPLLLACRERTDHS
jgi:hypothetical protein